MRILGIDPGYASTGFGVIEAEGAKLKLLCYGVIKTSAEDLHSTRLLQIYEKLENLIREFNPTVSCAEDLFFSRNTATAMQVSEAKGIITLCAKKAGLDLKIFKPNIIKLCVTGTARADKETVQKCIKILLNLKEEVKPDHAADALACAITYYNNLINDKYV